MKIEKKEIDMRESNIYNFKTSVYLREAGA